MAQDLPFGWTREGWRQIGLWSIALIVMSATAIAIHGIGSEEGIRAGIRWTARTSLLAFYFSFVAGPLAKHLRNDFTRNLMRARRYWGISFFISHMLHFVFIIALVITVYDSDFVGFFDARALIGGGAAYFLVTLMAFTSTNHWYQRLGAKNWRRLHMTGQIYVWLIFTSAFGGYALFGNADRGSPTLAAIIFAFLLGAMALRLIPKRKTP